MSTETCHNFVLHFYLSITEVFCVVVYILDRKKIVQPSLFLNTHPDILIQPAPVSLQVYVFYRLVLIVLLNQP